MFTYNGNSTGDVTGFTSLAGVSFPGTTVAQQPLPLLNGWKSAQGEWGTGDPSHSVTGDHVVHLSGSLDGSQVPSGLGDAGEEFAVLPSGARPFFCTSTETYTYAGVPGVLGIEPTGEMDAYAQGGHLINTPSAQYTSLAGISFPEASEAINGKALALHIGWSASTDSGCVNSYTVDPGYNLINGVVYLSGDMISSSSPDGYFATLPQEARPTHTLYLILNEGPAPHASLQISPNGDMTVFSSGVASGVDSLTGLSYQVSS